MTLSCPVIYACPDTKIPKGYCTIKLDNLTRGTCDDGNILIPYCPCESQEELISTGILIAAVVGISIAFIFSIVCTIVLFTIKYIRLKNRLNDEKELNKKISEAKKDLKAPMPDFVPDSSPVYYLAENIYHTVEEPNEKHYSKADTNRTNCENAQEKADGMKPIYSRVHKKRPDSNIVNLTENYIYNVEI
ncbi:unnamed protein product [Dimorphilus gyrociliatus]|uniref:Uncharacterized protein n=1 Tax=Dimorphilus gyrociliatus TaxID=2664684 RepID=A0A7I8V8K3_9ANNE|nr:unnamed protein product [Dimorphilus gyrociliatus]